MTRQARSVRCPESVLGWIPWYTELDEGGRPLLDDRQRGAVEAHASECADCRAELDMIAGAPYRIDFEIPDPDRIFHEITARIDAGEAEGRDTSPSPPSSEPAETIDSGERRLTEVELTRLEDWVFDADETDLEAGAARDAARVMRGPWSRPAFQVAAAAAVFVLGWLGGDAIEGVRLSSHADGVGAGGALYESAAAETSLEAAPEVLLDVVFVEGRTMEQVADALRAVGAEIVAGPSSVGRYRVRVDSRALSGSADVAAIAARLKAGDAPIAFFAEPALP